MREYLKEWLEYYDKNNLYKKSFPVVFEIKQAFYAAHKPPSTASTGQVTPVPPSRVSEADNLVP
jgi:hypothetical protein